MPALRLGRWPGFHLRGGAPLATILPPPLWRNVVAHPPPPPKAWIFTLCPGLGIVSKSVVRLLMSFIVCNKVLYMVSTLERTDLVHTRCVQIFLHRSTAPDTSSISLDHSISVYTYSAFLYVILFIKQLTFFSKLLSNQSFNAQPNFRTSLTGPYP